MNPNTARAFPPGRVLRLLPLLLVLSCSVGTKQEDENSSLRALRRQFDSYARPVRVGVLEFPDGSGQITPFSETVSDEVMNRLSKIRMIRLMERNRLKMLLSEHSLRQSGVLSRAEALRLGELLPVDMIVTGSYRSGRGDTRVNGRMIDLMTGEISATFAFSMEADGATSDSSRKGEDCPYDYRKAAEALRDLRTEESLQRAVNLLNRIPYTAGCAPLHTFAMTILEQGELFPESYKTHLAQGALRDTAVSQERRKYRLLHFYNRDHVVDEREWDTALLFMQEAKSREIRQYVRLGLHLEEGDPVLLRKRIDQLMKLAKEKPPGRPPVTPFEMLTHINYSAGNFAEARPLRFKLHLYDTWMDSVPAQGKEILAAFGQLSYGVRYSRNFPALQDRFLDLIVRLMGRFAPGSYPENTLNQLWKQLPEIHSHLGKRHNRFASFVRDLAPWLCTSASRSPYVSVRKYRNGFLRKYRISCEAAVDVTALTARFASAEADWKVREEAARQLLKLGEAGRSAEKTAVEYLGERGDSPGAYQVRKYSIELLSLWKSRHPEALHGLVVLLGNPSHRASALLTLQRMNPQDTLPHLRRALRESKDLPTLRGVMEILRYYGPGGRAALPELRKLEREGKTPAIREMAKRTAERVQGR